MIILRKTAAGKRTLSARAALACLAVIIGIGSGPLTAHALNNDYTWSKIATSDAYPYQSATSSDGRVSVVAGDTAVITHDRGATWQSLNDTLAAIPGASSGNWYGGVGMSSNGQKIALIGSDGQLYASSDSGATWSLKVTPMTRTDPIAMSGDGMKLAVVNNSSIYISTDGGTTWTQRASGSNAEYVSMSADGTVLLYSDETADGIYRSTDDGVTWTKDTAGGTLNLYNIQLSANGQTAIAQNYNDDSVYTSVDSGITWSQILRAPVNSYNVYLSSDGGTILVFDGYTRHKSTDHGATWATQPSNADAWVRGGGSASADLSVLIGVNDDYGDLFASQDGGATWTVPLLQGGKWWASMATTSDGSTVLLTDADGHIYFSHNHGTTWNFGYDVRDDGDNTGGDLWGTALSTDGSHMVVSDDNANAHLLTSSDGGVTWVKNTTAGIHDWYDVALSGDGQKIVAITKSGVVYTSTNFGTSWTINTSIQNSFPTTGGSSAQTDVDMSPDGTRLAITEQGMTSTYNSTTNTWVYTGTSHLYTSADGGATWTLRTTPADSGSVGIQDTAMSSDGQTLAFVTTGSSTSVYLSKDGGATWTKDPGTGLPVGGPASQYSQYNQVSVSSDGQVIAVSDFGHDKSYVTTDGGATWITYSNHDPDSPTSGTGVVATAVSGDGTQIYVATNNVFRGALAGTDTGGSTSGSNLPSAPQNTTATATGPTNLEVTWQAPVDEGSSPLTGYRIRYRIANTLNWTVAGETAPSTLSYTIAGLSPTTTYDVQVIAVTALGASADVPAQANDAITTATTLEPGQAASSGVGGVFAGLAETGANVWFLGTMGIASITGGALLLRRLSRR